MRRYAKNRKLMATAMKIGRYGAKAVRLPIHASEKPNRTGTSGPRQQSGGKDRSEAAHGQCTLTMGGFGHGDFSFPACCRYGKVSPQSSTGSGA